MSEPIIPREQVARELAVPARVLVRYEARGLVHSAREGQVEGYEPSEVRRLWSIVSYQRDLGVNLAGVEVILKLRDYLADVHHRLGSETARLIEALDEASPGDRDA
jgi:MerR family transcriptional regulator/heat shock protein HspR